MKKYAILIGVLCLLAACSTTSSTYQKISANDVQAMVENNEEIVIVDVRNADEYASGHIENAVLLPLADIETNAKTQLPDLNQKIIVYCRSGNRSQSAAKELIAIGYTNVYDLGGINNWPYSIVK